MMYYLTFLIEIKTLKSEICYNGLSLPLIARTRKQGDMLTFKKKEN